MIKIRIVFGKTDYDPCTAWTDMKTIEIEMPDNFKDYHVLGSEVIENPET